MWPNWWYRVVIILCLGFFKVHNRYRVIGKEKAPKEKPVIIASNHVSALDPVMLGLAFPRRVRPLAKEELFTGNKMFKWLITSLGAIPLNRETNNASSAALKKFIDVLRGGMDMMIFPEGGRSYDGRLMVLEGGAALVAARERVPLVPMWIKGAFEAMPIGSSKIGWDPITVVYGDVIYPPENMSPKEARAYMHEELTKALTELQARDDAGEFDR